MYFCFKTPLHVFHQIGKFLQYFMVGEKDCAMFTNPLSFPEKPVNSAYLTCMVLCLFLLCDWAIHLPRVCSTLSPECCLGPLSFPKPSPPSLLSLTLSKRFQSVLFFAYSIILLKYDLLKTWTELPEDPIVNDNQFLILHYLKLSHS